MRLISCYIDNFGLLCDKKIDFSRGLNCFFSDNSTGKSTLTVFIKAMLYGFGDNRASKEENERKKYLPWQGGRYGGSLTFEAEGKTYTAERTFGAKIADDSFLLRDETTGGVSRKYTENLGQELFGIDRDGFIRTVFLSERAIAPGTRVTGSVASRLSDIMGSDGDVGNYKKAMELLEERRKVYQKRGGGEIERLRLQIAEYNRKLDELERLVDVAEKKAGDIAALKVKIAALEAEREALGKRLEEIAAARSRTKNREVYLRMKGDLEREEKRLKELLDFFGGVVPTLEEIDAARDARREADALMAELTAGESDSELIRLADFFAPGTSLSEIDDIELLARRTAEDEARIAKIEAKEDERSREMRELFPARIPTKEEIDSAIAAAKRGGGVLGVILTVLGLVAIAAGIGLGFINTALYSICALGAVLTVVGIVVRVAGAAKGKERAKSLLREISRGGSGDLLGRLYEKKMDLERYERLAEAREAEAGELRSRIARANERMSSFFTRFGLAPEDRVSAIRQVRRDYQRYSALSMSEERTAGERIAKVNRERELSAKAKAFVARFRTVSADPFGEIKDKATDYYFCRERVAEGTKQCENFARVYGITENEDDFDPTEEERIKSECVRIDSEILTARRELAVMTREHSDLISEIESADDIRAAKEGAEESLASCLRSLENVKITKSILEQAYNNMTARYTGKTRERFLHYVGLISGEAGEYRLDTKFEITRVERGVAREEDAYSRGTRDLYSLAMRLALTDSLYDGELPFLILDDPFIALDDGKCERAKAMLKAIAKERQILYFTCSSARAIK